MHISKVGYQQEIVSNNSRQQKSDINFKGSGVELLKKINSDEFFRPKTVRGILGDLIKYFGSAGWVTTAGAATASEIAAEKAYAADNTNKVTTSNTTNNKAGHTTKITHGLTERWKESQKLREERKRQKEALRKQRQKNCDAWQMLRYYCKDYVDSAYNACANADGNITYAYNLLTRFVDSEFREMGKYWDYDERKYRIHSYLVKSQCYYLVPLLEAFNNAKDKNGNHTSKNLDFLDYLTKNKCNGDWMTFILRKAKDKDGNIDSYAAKKLYSEFWDDSRDVDKFGDVMQHYYSLSEQGKKDLLMLNEKHHGHFIDFHKTVQMSKGKDYEKIINAINAYMDSGLFSFCYNEKNRILISLKLASDCQKIKGDNTDEGISYENFRAFLIKTILAKNTVSEFDEYFFDSFLKDNQLRNYVPFWKNCQSLMFKNNKYLISINKKLNSTEKLIKIAELTRDYGMNNLIKAIDSDLDTYSVETILSCIEKSFIDKKDISGQTYKVVSLENYKKMIMMSDKKLAENADLLKNKNGTIDDENIEAYKTLQETFEDDDEVSLCAKILKDKDGIIRKENIEPYKKIKNCLLDDSIKAYLEEQNLDYDYIEQLKEKNNEVYKALLESFKIESKIRDYVRLSKNNDGIIQDVNIEIIKELEKSFGKDYTTRNFCIDASKDMYGVVRKENIEAFKIFYEILKDSQISLNYVSLAKDKDGVVTSKALEIVKDLIINSSNQDLEYKNIAYCKDKLTNKKGEIQWDFIPVFSELKNKLEKEDIEKNTKIFTNIFALSCDNDGNIYKEMNEIIPELIKNGFVVSIPEILKICIKDNKFIKENYTKAVNLIKETSYKDQHEMVEFLLNCKNDDGSLDDTKINLLNTLKANGCSKDNNRLVYADDCSKANIRLANLIIKMPDDSEQQKALDLIQYLMKNSKYHYFEGYLPDIISDFIITKDGKLNDDRIKITKEFLKFEPKYTNLKLSELLKLTLNSKEEVDDNKFNIISHALKEIKNDNNVIEALKRILSGSKEGFGEDCDIDAGYKLIEFYNARGLEDLKAIDCFLAYRDDYRKINKEILDALVKAGVAAELPQKLTKEYLMEFKTDFICKKYAKKNMYLPETVYEFLDSLDKYRLLNDSIMDRKIGDYGQLFLLLPDIVRNETNKDTYNNMLQLLESLPSKSCYDFNMKDYAGVSFIEKVIYRENFALLDFIKNAGNKKLIYEPVLEHAVNGIENDDFRAKLKELNFDFGEFQQNWDRAARLRSISALEKMLPTFKSPLCNQERLVERTWNFAKMIEHGIYTKKEVGKFLCEAFKDEISEGTMFMIINECAAEPEGEISTTNHYHFNNDY